MPKHSPAEKVSVYIDQNDHHIEISFRDNGSGFDPGKQFCGNGMSSFKKRVTELNARFNITSHINEGTMVQIGFKIT